MATIPLIPPIPFPNTPPGVIPDIPTDRAAATINTSSVPANVIQAAPSNMNSAIVPMEAKPTTAPAIPVIMPFFTQQPKPSNYQASQPVPQYPAAFPQTPAAIPQAAATPQYPTFPQAQQYPATFTAQPGFPQFVQQTVTTTPSNIRINTNPPPITPVTMNAPTAFVAPVAPPIIAAPPGGMPSFVAKPGSRKGQPWTKEEDNNLIAELQQQKSYAEIATIHGRTSNAVKTKAMELVMRMVTLGTMNINDAATLAGVTPQELSLMGNKYAPAAPSPGHSVTIIPGPAAPTPVITPAPDTNYQERILQQNERMLSLLTDIKSNLEVLIQLQKTDK